MSLASRAGREKRKKWNSSRLLWAIQLGPGGSLLESGSEEMNHFWCDISCSLLPFLSLAQCSNFSLLVSLLFWPFWNFPFSVPSFHSSRLPLVSSSFPPPVSPHSSVAFSLSLFALVVPLVALLSETSFLSFFVSLSYSVAFISLPSSSPSLSRGSFHMSSWRLSVLSSFSLLTTTSSSSTILFFSLSLSLCFYYFFPPEDFSLTSVNNPEVY